MSTPQKIALADAQKGLAFFNKVEIPVLGIIENMSGFQCPKCDEITPIFGTDGVNSLATENETCVLGKVPLDPSLMRGSDEGQPVVVSEPNSKTAKCYVDIATKIINQIKT